MDPTSMLVYETDWGEQKTVPQKSVAGEQRDDQQHLSLGKAEPHGFCQPYQAHHDSVHRMESIPQVCQDHINEYCLEEKSFALRHDR